jgi:hypothetical protein
MARRRAKDRSAPRQNPTNVSDASPRPSPFAAAAPWRDRAIVGAVAIAASVAGIANDFVFDDVPQVVENFRIHDLSRIGEILTSPYWPPPYAPELFRPVASIAAALQYVIGAGSPATFRIVSYLLYALAAVGVYSLATRLLPRRIALGVGVLFAAHPVHVEAVALAVNQGELIVGWAATAATVLYIDRRRNGGLTIRDWTVLCVLFAVAALSKENGFVLPGLLVAAECSVIVAENRLRAVGRGYAALAAVGVVLLVARAAVLSGNVAGALPAKAIAGLSLGGRLLTTLQIVPKWLRLLAWPAHLQIDYSPNEIVASTHLGAQELLGLGLLIAFALITWIARRRAPAITFGIAWCAIALFPVSNIVPTGIVLAERTLFLPSIGFLIAVAGAIELLLEQYAMKRATVERPLAAACGLLAIVGVVRSDLRQRTWRNGQAMWQAAEVDAPRSLRVQQAHDEAVADLTRDFERAIATSPTPWRVRFELATLLRYMRADSAALGQLRKSVAAHPNQGDATLELSATLISTGSYAEAKNVVSSLQATGDTARVAQRLTALADSAAGANAPAGSVRVIARELLAAEARR